MNLLPQLKNLFLAMHASSSYKRCSCVCIIPFTSLSHFQAIKHSMPMEAQRVVVIQDASRKVSSSAIKWAIDGLSLKDGDELTLVSVLHEVNNPLGYKSKVDSKTLVGTNQRIIEEEIKKKEEQYEKNTDLMQISKLYAMRNINFRNIVVAGSSPKIIAVEMAKKLEATWVILDRQMKKERKYFLARLSCGVSRIKRNFSVRLLRGRIDDQEKVKQTKRTIQSNTIKKNKLIHKQEKEPRTSKMIQETTMEDDLFSLEFTPLKQNAHQNNSSNGKIKQSSSNEGHARVTETKHYYDNDDDDDDDDDEHSFITLEGSKWRVASNEGANTLQEKLIFKEFAYDELRVATDGFSRENFISEGGFGSVFKGMLKNGQWIAVKQHKHASMQGEKEFRAEVHLLSRARHKNVVKLLGSCSEGSHRLLVYEYVSNGSLDTHLSKDNSRVLSWKGRMNIALGVASGLNYLHQNNIIHRDMRPNNILISQSYEPLLGDFGLAKAQKDDADKSSETKIVGTFGYLAPEYAEKGKFSTKTDVYSFGVVLLELITGRTTMDRRLEEKSLVVWAKPLLEERKYQELIDERLVDCHDVHQLFWMVSIAEKCLSKHAHERPSMHKVENALRCIVHGETVEDMDEFSPTHSIFNCLSLSCESQGEQEMASSDVSPINKNINAPLEPKLGSPDENLSSSGRRSFGRNRSKYRNRVFYDEMLSA